MPNEDYLRFRDLNFEGFRQMAQDPSLTSREKIGFPESYRAGREEAILRDVVAKLPALDQREKLIMDVGPGCSPLAFMLIDLCREKGHRLVLVDSAEMLAHLPEEPFITRIPAYYPMECSWVFEKYAGQVDAFLTYSVLHYVFAEGNLFDFVDRSLGLLAGRGRMLIGDVPNVSKRKRFFASTDGIQFHQDFTESEEVPYVQFNSPEPGSIDDAVILSLLLRCRSAGFDAYVVPQGEDLPMANRREDLLIVRP